MGIMIVNEIMTTYFVLHITALHDNQVAKREAKVRTVTLTL